MKDHKAISDRKADHIALALKDSHQSAQGAGFDRLRFEPNPLPQMALEDIDHSSQFCGGCGFLFGGHDEISMRFFEFRVPRMV